MIDELHTFALSAASFSIIAAIIVLIKESKQIKTKKNSKIKEKEMLLKNFLENENIPDSLQEKLLRLSMSNTDLKTIKEISLICKTANHAD